MPDPSPSVPGVAVVGCGAWGRNHVRVFHELGALRAVVDDLPDTAQAAAAATGAMVARFDDALARPDVAGIVIATPDPTHAALACRALEAGKHVLVEKPMAMSLADADAVARIGAARERTVLVGHILHYHPAFRRLRAMVAEGAAGAIRHIASKRLHLSRGAPRHALWDLAPHDLSMVLAVAGRLPRTVRALAAAPLPGAPPQCVTLALAFDGDLYADVAVSAIHPVKLHQFTVLGGDGQIVFEDSRPWPEKLALYRPGLGGDGAAQREGIAVEPGEPLGNEARAFLAAIAKGSAPPTGPEEAIPVVRVLAAAERALASGGPESP